ncbi:MAG: transglutaminase domain-containing protein [Sandaracinaceae bacterium]|nr:transglutaminase domain-containing protein [Sandaracinaceae bacterium]
MKRATSLVLLLLAAAVCVVTVHADNPPVLHEYVPNVHGEEGSLLVSRGGDAPEAIVVNGEVIPPPDRSNVPEDEAPMSSQPTTPGDTTPEPGRRSTTFRPDRLTELQSNLDYYEAFAPAIAPYKRVSALNAVTLAEDGVTPVLTIASRMRTVIPVEGADTPARDGRARAMFWGTVVLEFEGGTEVPLPSVSPESRILTVRTQPETLLRFERDEADNYFAVATHPMSGSVRVTFLMDAPESYFSTPIPAVVTIGELANTVPEMPATVMRRATTFANELGLRRGMPYRTIIETLTRHFRSFEESERPPPNSGDIFLDLARGMKGVCRHRAYGFVITAQALGIPARFVQNEAHAWTEIRLPGALGWMRVDLGGAAHGLTAHNAQDAPRYQPRLPDMLPRPETFAHSNGEPTNMQGMRDDATTDNGQSPLPSATQPGGGTNGNQGGTQAGGTNGNHTGPALRPGAILRPSGPADPNETRAAVSIAVSSFYHDVFRGRELQVTGNLADANGVGLPGMRIEVSLAAPRGDRAVLLGVTVTREGGDFRASFGVPPSVPVGDYRLIVLTPGDATHLPAQAN